MLETASDLASDGHVLAVREPVAIIEALYATGVRVSGSIGLDVADLDRTFRRTLRVLGRPQGDRPLRAARRQGTGGMAASAW